MLGKNFIVYIVNGGGNCMVLYEIIMYDIIVFL